MNVFPLGNRGIGLLFFQTGIIGDSSVDAKVDSFFTSFRSIPFRMLAGQSVTRKSGLLPMSVLPSEA